MPEHDILANWPSAGGRGGNGCREGGASVDRSQTPPLYSPPPPLPLTYTHCAGRFCGARGGSAVGFILGPRHTWPPACSGRRGRRLHTAGSALCGSRGPVPGRCRRPGAAGRGYGGVVHHPTGSGRHPTGSGWHPTGSGHPGGAGPARCTGAGRGGAPGRDRSPKRRGRRPALVRGHGCRPAARGWASRGRAGPTAAGGGGV